MNRLSYSLRRSLLMTILSKVSRRVNFSVNSSRSLSDTKLGLLISTSPVVAQWDLATARGNQSLLVSFALFLGFWRVSLSVTI